MIVKPQELIARAKASVDCVSPEQARSLSEHQPNTVLIDVREPGEVEQSSVPGAINIPRGVLEMTVEEQVPDHDCPVLVCCATGGRAALSAKTLKEMGYTQVKVIDCEHLGIKTAFAQ
ncbi:MAG: hypothetical protein CMK32_12490 [Porticoccaceae bacterium]|nr:hypothetical protein [Porticoccaceae bacterium]